MAKIYVEIRGGVFIGAYSDDPSTKLYVFDWDDVAAADPDDSRQRESATGFSVSCEPIRTMSDDTLALVQQAN